MKQQTSLIIIIILIINIIFIINRINSIVNNDLIFISIPSYRDNYCKKTVRSIFDNAKYPEKIRLGIYEQNNTNNEGELCDKYKKYRHQIRYLRSDYRDAKGPLYARAKIYQHLYKNEKYFLMIDSHSLFLPNWDVEMIKQLKFLGKTVRKPLLSSYPNTVKFKDNEIIKDTNDDETTVICQIVNSNGYPTVQKAIYKPEGYFYQTYQISANYLFTYGQCFKDINLKPDYPYIFGGEEILISALAYTHGWDIYSFAKNYVYHYYYHDNPNWNKEIVENNQFVLSEKQKSHKKLLTILKTNDNNYPMGNKRTLKEFWEKLGFDHTKSTLKEQNTQVAENNRCRNLKKIKYLSHS